MGVQGDRGAAGGGGEPPSSGGKKTSSSLHHPRRSGVWGWGFFSRWSMDCGGVMFVFVVLLLIAVLEDLVDFIVLRREV